MKKITHTFENIDESICKYLFKNEKHLNGDFELTIKCHRKEVGIGSKKIKIFKFSFKNFQGPVYVMFEKAVSFVKENRLYSFEKPIEMYGTHMCAEITTLRREGDECFVPNKKMVYINSKILVEPFPGCSHYVRWFYELKN